MASNTVTSALRSILNTGSNLSTELSTAIISLGWAIDQLGNKQEGFVKELELVRRMTRINWLMVINLPSPFGVSKSHALQLLFNKLGYGKPLFDTERDFLATDLPHMNRNGLPCNMSIYISSSASVAVTEQLAKVIGDRSTTTRHLSC